MLSRLYLLTNTQLQSLMQMELNGDERYAGWVNKHFTGLMKRVTPNQTPFAKQKVLERKPISRVTSLE